MINIIKKTILIYIALFIAGLVLAGCSKKDNKTQESEVRQDIGDEAAKQTSEVATQTSEEVAPPLPEGPPPSLFPSAPSTDATSQTPADASVAASKPQWDVPNGWQGGQSSPTDNTTFAVKGEDGQSAEVAISSSPGDAGGLIASVNRWRSEIGLGPVTPDEVASMTADVDMDGVKVTLIDFRNESVPTGKTHPQGVIVVILPHDGNSWIFKMSGDAPLVGSQHEELLQFVKSVKF